MVFDSGKIWGMLPCTDGTLGVFHWGTHRRPEETWDAFVKRSADETLVAVANLPSEGQVVVPVGGRIFYNLTFVEENE